MTKNKHLHRSLKIFGLAIVVVVAFTLGFGKKSAAVGPFTGDASTYAVYHFEGDCNDSSGHNNNLSLVSGSFSPDAAVGSQSLTGQCLGDALNLDGIGDGSSDWTVAFWLKADKNIEDPRSTLTNVTFLRMDTGANCDGLVVNCGLALLHSNGSIAWKNGGGTPPVDDNIYHHIAVRANHSSFAMDFFVDGALVSSVFADPRWVVAPTGHLHLNAQICCNGHLDEVVIENRKMTDAEIISLAGKTPPDTTPPVISHATLAPQYLLNSAPLAFTYGATDTGSGVASVSATLDGAPFASGGNLNFSQVGPHAIVISAKDVAGNIATETINYRVVYGGCNTEGFLPPIKNDGTGVYQLGRTLPTKFQLKDAGGNFIPTASAKLFVAPIVGGVPQADQIPHSSSHADVGNQFRVAGNKYRYNLATDTMTEGLWQLKAALDDGTSCIAKATFSKKACTEDNKTGVSGKNDNNGKNEDHDKIKSGEDKNSNCEIQDEDKNE